MKYLLLILALVFTGCENFVRIEECDIQQCKNGILTFRTCGGRNSNLTIILTDDNGEALRCNSKNQIKEH
jgi:hypothetical protein